VLDAGEHGRKIDKDAVLGQDLDQVRGGEAGAQGRAEAEGTAVIGDPRPAGTPGAGLPR
jgi:hypothetical protein